MPSALRDHLSFSAVCPRNCHAVVLASSLLVAPAAAQEVSVEFEDFFTSIAQFDVYSPLPGPLITGESNAGAGGSGGIALPGRHALTYTPLSFAFAADGDAVTASTMFKTGNLAPPTGFNEIIGQVHITSQPSGNSFEFFGSNDFFASVYRDSTGAYIGISGQTSSGSFWPFLETPLFSLQSNRWYELSATFTRDGTSELDADFEVRDYGPQGTTAGPIVGIANSSFPGQSAAFLDSTWYGGFAADADNGVKVDRFRLDAPGDAGGPEIVTIEPTFDVTYWRRGSQQFFEGEEHLSIDGGEAQFPELNALAEFDLGDVPPNAEITAASLIIEPIFTQNMIVRAMAFTGDGQLTASDPGFLLYAMGQSTGTLQAGVDKTISLSTSFIEGATGPGRYLGLVLESTTAGPFVDVVASEASTGTPPTLVIEYTLPETNGDFDGDADVDGADLLAWQRGESPQPHSAADLAEWRANFGRLSAVAAADAIPEPTAGPMLAWAALTGLLRRRFLGRS